MALLPIFNFPFSIFNLPSDAASEGMHEQRELRAAASGGGGPQLAFARSLLLRLRPADFHSHAANDRPSRQRDEICGFAIQNARFLIGRCDCRLFDCGAQPRRAKARTLRRSVPPFAGCRPRRSPRFEEPAARSYGGRRAAPSAAPRSSLRRLRPADFHSHAANEFPLPAGAVAPEALLCRATSQFSISHFQFSICHRLPNTAPKISRAVSTVSPAGAAG